MRVYVCREWALILSICWVRVIVTLLAGMMGAGMTLYSAVFLYAFLANAFFLVRPYFHPPLCSLYSCSRHPSFLAPLAAQRRAPGRDQLIGDCEPLAAQETDYVPLPRGGHAAGVYGYSRADLSANLSFRAMSVRMVFWRGWRRIMNLATGRRNTYNMRVFAIQMN